jgi:hypothetical protein
MSRAKHNLQLQPNQQRRVPNVSTTVINIKRNIKESLLRLMNILRQTKGEWKMI